MSKNQPAAPAWTQQLRPGTILLFRFPERDDDLAGKRRPCLVLGTQPGPDGPQIALAYGTSVNSSANRGFDISVEADDCASVGTHRPTRFVLARRITVGVDDPRFDTGTEDNLIVGQLLDDQMGQLKALTGFLGSRVFEDAMPRPRRKPPFRRHRDQPKQDHARIISERREISAPMRRSRSAGSTARTVIVEHRRKRMPRPTPSAA